MSDEEFHTKFQAVLEEVMSELEVKYKIQSWFLYGNSFNYEMAGAQSYTWEDFQLEFISKIHVRDITIDMFSFGPHCCQTLEAKNKDRVENPHHSGYRSFLKCLAFSR